MYTFVAVSFASVALASQPIFKAVNISPAAWPNYTCTLWDEDLLLVRDPVCRPGFDHTASKPPVVSSPWTQSPACTTTDGHPGLFCVYTSSTFAGGRGISIFSTPAAAVYLAQSAAFTDPPDLHDVNVEASPPYAVQPVPGRGMGAIVNRTLHRGDSIFSHTPVVILHRKTYDLLGDKDRRQLQRDAVYRLPPRTRELFLGLHGHFGGEKVDDILETNSFRLDLSDDEDDSHTMVLPETSASARRINHDCRPNAHYYFDMNTMTHHVNALRTIHVGEELTISYTDVAASRADRQAAIKLSWGFDCSCSLCTQHEHLVRESDRRLELIAELENYLESWSEASPATPEMAERLISLYEQERLLAPIAVAYVYAALAYNAVGNEQLAMKHAALAIEATMLNSGPEFSDVESMRELLEKPRSHWSWKMRLSN